jgi:DNA-binding transcriptional ArsR family regulator
MADFSITRRRPTAPIDEHAVALALARAMPPRAEREARRLVECASDLTRIKILRALLETPLAASDLARVVGRSAAATSQHMRVLRSVNAVIPTRSGNVVRYRLSKETSAVVLEAIARAFDALGRRE